MEGHFVRIEIWVVCIEIGHIYVWHSNKPALVTAIHNSDKHGFCKDLHFDKKKLLSKYDH